MVPAHVARWTDRSSGHRQASAPVGVVLTFFLYPDGPFPSDGSSLLPQARHEKPIIRACFWRRCFGPQGPLEFVRQNLNFPPAEKHQAKRYALSRVFRLDDVHFLVMKVLYPSVSPQWDVQHVWRGCTWKIITDSSRHGTLSHPTLQQSHHSLPLPYYIMAGYLADYQKTCAELTDAIFKWADPAGTMLKSPTRTWPLAGLDVALAIAAAYLVFVFVGSVRVIA